MIGDPALAWQTREPDRVRALLAAVGFRDGRVVQMTVAGLAIVLVRTPARPPWSRPGWRPVAPPDGPTGPAHGCGPSAGRRSTAGDARPRSRRLPAPLPEDTLLGARATASDDPRIVLLEPSTEGRLAATLARHGEGPAALYLAVRPLALTATGLVPALGERPRTGSGPFGSELLATTPSSLGTPPLVVARAGHGRRAPG